MSGFYGYRWKGEPTKIPNTDQNSFNPAVNSYIPHLSTSNIYHLAWQQNTSNGSEIRYYKLVINPNYTLPLSDYAVPSSGNGSSYNYTPSIIVLKDGLPRLAWSSSNGSNISKAIYVEEQIAL